MANVKLVSPLGPDSIDATDGAPRLLSLRGARIGFLVNEKGDATATDFEQDSEILEAWLREKYEVSAVTRVVKASAFKPADSELIEELAASSDCVINGLAK